MTGQLPDASGALSSSQPTRVEPLRPEWPIWQQILAVGFGMDEIDEALPGRLMRPAHRDRCIRG